MGVIFSWLDDLIFNENRCSVDTNECERNPVVASMLGFETEPFSLTQHASSAEIQAE